MEISTHIDQNRQLVSLYHARGTEMLTLYEETAIFRGEIDTLGELLDIEKAKTSTVLRSVKTPSLESSAPVMIRRRATRSYGAESLLETVTPPKSLRLRGTAD